jgi:uncharacterized protein (TIGR03118 family)
VALVGLGATTFLLFTAGPALAHGSYADHRTGPDILFGPGFTQTNIVADQPGHAKLTDPHLVNPWGMSRGTNSPIWVSNNGTGTSTLYTGAVGTTPPGIVPLVVAIPGGAPTGQVFNDTTGFVVPGTKTPAHFIFASESGRITAWASGMSAVLAQHVTGASYKGLALAHSPFGPLLLGANFAAGRIDVFDSTFDRLNVPLLFHDPFLPLGYAPFNVAELGGRIYVTYAKVNPTTGDDVPGIGHGFIDVFTTYGAFVKRLVSRGVLDSPWGLAIAPAHFGTFAGDLLVGNFGNGWINVFNPSTGRFLGFLTDAHLRPIVIDGLWGLLVGDAAAGGPDAVWFSAGPDGEAHGLVGLLTAN